MFEMFRNQSRSAAGAIQYVTVGTLMIIWAGLWYYYFIMPVATPSPLQRYICVGIIVSGCAILLIGLLFGIIGHGAKRADTTLAVAAAPNFAPAVPAVVNQPAVTTVPGPATVGHLSKNVVPLSPAPVNSATMARLDQ